ncbi:hypothetical protein [Natrarchaeobius chitinivorans]|uniref:Uncharacterized protein n=1 Tax=Natrarchaeobius chitinivorans TaxID=1679083 RepID=A0A3N6MBK5_NATCH|nr:hypothetical protein [Natrarchaeobius chitinivorans]RQG93850.1 hypothetical protein EA473_14160 [Natrarchaeobius chitinivorans]
MTDERPHRSRNEGDEPADDGSSDGLEPGGGPRRVVSERSVDDILDSLDRVDPSDAESDSTPTAEPDEDAESDSTPTAEPDGRTETDPDERTEIDPGDTGSNPASGRAGTTEITESASVDAASDALQARIERGDVTGADVRAAEAGEGREPTSDIGEIELSMDDLEASEPAVGVPNREADDTHGSGGGRYEDDAGRREGTTDTESTTRATDSRDDAGDESDGSGGVFGRLKRFFSS